LLNHKIYIGVFLFFFAQLVILLKDTNLKNEKYKKFILFVIIFYYI